MILNILISIEVIIGIYVLIKYGYFYSHRKNILQQKIHFLNDKLKRAKNIEEFSTNFYEFRIDYKFDSHFFYIESRFLDNRLYKKYVSKYNQLLKFGGVLFKELKILGVIFVLAGISIVIIQQGS